MAANERWRNVRERLAKAQDEYNRDLEESKSRFDSELFKLCEGFEEDLDDGEYSESLLNATTDVL